MSKRGRDDPTAGPKDRAPKPAQSGKSGQSTKSQGGPRCAQLSAPQRVACHLRDVICSGDRDAERVHRLEDLRGLLQADDASSFDDGVRLLLDLVPVRLTRVWRSAGEQDWQDAGRDAPEAQASSGHEHGLRFRPGLTTVAAVTSVMQRCLDGARAAAYTSLSTGDIEASNEDVKECVAGLVSEGRLQVIDVTTIVAVRDPAPGGDRWNSHLSDLFNAVVPAPEIDSITSMLQQRASRSWQCASAKGGP